MEHISKIIDEVMKNATFAKKSLDFHKTKDDEYQIEEVKVKFTYKDNAIFVGDNKIADIKFENKKPKFVFTKKHYKDDLSAILTDYYEENFDKIKNNVTNEIDVSVTISDILGSVGSHAPSGKEYTYLEPEDFKVTLGDIVDGPNIKKFIDKDDIKKILDYLEEEANRDYKQKYVGDL